MLCSTLALTAFGVQAQGAGADPGAFPPLSEEEEDRGSEDLVLKEGDKRRRTAKRDEKGAKELEAAEAEARRAEAEARLEAAELKKASAKAIREEREEKEAGEKAKEAEKRQREQGRQKEKEGRKKSDEVKKGLEDMEKTTERRFSQAGVRLKQALTKGIDKVLPVEVDKDDENEYWKVGPIKILRKETSFEEIFVAGFVSGGLVELGGTVMLHPLDTIKTRLQTKSAVKSNDEGLMMPEPVTYNRVFDGLGPVVATVPILALFWAVKDVVRVGIIQAVTSVVPVKAAGEAIATTFASACGEAVYWAAKTPGQVAKTQQQVEVLELPTRDQDSSLPVPPPQISLWQQSIVSFPVLAAVDVPQVAMRTAFFVLLEDMAWAPTGVGSDVLLFTVASCISAVVTTPLDVARTQLILSGLGVQELLPTILKIWRTNGVPALMAGWVPRFLWNGVIVGLTFGLLRLSYSDLRAVVMLDVLDTFEGVVQPYLPASVDGLLPSAKDAITDAVNVVENSVALAIQPDSSTPTRRPTSSGSRRSPLLPFEDFPFEALVPET